MNYRWEYELKDGTRRRGVEDELPDAYDKITARSVDLILTATIHTANEGGKAMGAPIFSIRGTDNAKQSLVAACSHCGGLEQTSRRDSHLGLLIVCPCGVITAFAHKPDDMDRHALNLWNSRHG